MAALTDQAIAEIKNLIMSGEFVAGSYNALRDRDAKRAAAAGLIHLSEGEQWLRQLMQAEEALTVLATAPPDTDLSGNGDENAGNTP